MTLKNKPASLSLTKNTAIKRALIIEISFSVVIILFWSYVLYTKIGDLEEFRKELLNQVFPKGISRILVFVLPMIWLTICTMLAFSEVRLAGMLLNLLVLSSFTVYVGLAILDVYRFMPCSCAGLFHLQWEGQFYFNLIATAVAAAGFIFTLKNKERRTAVWIL